MSLSDYAKVRLRETRELLMMAEGIEVHEMVFPDGDPPSKDIIKAWLEVCDKAFKGGNRDKGSVTVHCVAGLGRAPVLVAIALIEAGKDPEDAVEMIREKRTSALNRRQMAFLLEDYKPRRGGPCCVM